VRRPTERGWSKIALAAIALGALTRFLWVLWAHPPLNYLHSDMLSYVGRAQVLASGGHLGRYAAFYPPGTHLLIALPLSLFGVHRSGLWAASVVWALLSSLTPFFVWRLGRVLISPAAAALAAVFCAAWPLHISYAGYFLSETPSLAFLTASLWLGYAARRAPPRRAVLLATGSGLLGAAALACRPQFLFNLLLLGLPLLWRRHRYLPALTGLIAGAAIGIGAVIAYNSLSAGRFVPTLAEDGGIVFFQGHCPVLVVSTGHPGTFQYTLIPPPAFQRGVGQPFSFPQREAWDEAFFYREGLKCIRKDGVAHLTRVAQNVADMTATLVPWPQIEENGDRQFATVVNFVYSVALFPIMYLSLLLIGRRRSAGDPSGELVLLGHLACLFLLALVTFGDPRFRTPYDVFGLALLAAVIASRWFEEPRATERG
jgi:4-amino-4-deoxy-L-arabinose transferase-like glycosyltransferase